jgi:D-alanyl-D-alanine dipeptidase
MPVARIYLRRFRLVIALLALPLIACGHGADRAGGDVSPAVDADEADMLDAAVVIPGLDTDIRYAGPRNFTGNRVDGYEAGKCYLHAEAAHALARVEARLRSEGLRLRVFDCYRPMRAVRHFVRWAAEPEDPAVRAEYHPRIDKSALIPGYISDRSGHSRGATVDLTMLSCDGADRCVELDMGTPFDFFDVRANTAHEEITPEQRRNRDRLVEAMAREGFANYPMEWWHFTYRPEPTPATFHDFPVR